MQRVIGIDEVGRGCWAGPLLVVAARGYSLPAVKDSKLLSRLQRKEIFKQLQGACEFGEGWVEASEIDTHGLTAAMKLGVQRALEALRVVDTEPIIMDGHINYCPERYQNVECIVRADATHPIVSAASIYAKVLRDQRMAELATQHPHYGFESHVGYGTKKHLDAIKQFGICSLHRKSYKPIRVFI